MIAISLRFPAGRIHSTPWARQVNEGEVEWPISPWRILRALIATWHHKAKDITAEPVLRSLIEKLAAEAPSYYLPPAATGHTRHFMPYIEGRNEKRSKVFDTFIHVQDQEAVEAVWANVQLTDAESSALRTILKRMSYFGRAESLVEAALVSQPHQTSNSWPMSNGKAPGEEEELVRIIGPMPVDDYRAWHDGYLAALSETAIGPRGRGKRASKIALPGDVYEALLADTSDLKRSGWSQPPGSRWIDYLRPRNAFKIQAGARGAAPRAALPTVARFAVASQVLPQLTQSVSVAERIHQSLVKLSNNAPVFTGLDELGNPLQGHQHAHIFCEATTHRGSINRITVFAPAGFDSTARRSLDGLRKVWGHGGHDLQLILLGVGAPVDFAGYDLAGDQCPLFVEAKEWHSITPFVPTRHAKAHRDGRPKLDHRGLQIGSPEHDLLRLINEAGLPEPTELGRMTTGLAGLQPTRWLAFQRQRRHGDGGHAGQIGYGFRLVFPLPVRGPLAFGYACHFGLGLFAGG